MKLKASMVVMSHLSDAQEMIHLPGLGDANEQINFAKYIILETRGDLTEEINADEMWDNFLNRNK